MTAALTRRALVAAALVLVSARRAGKVAGDLHRLSPRSAVGGHDPVAYFTEGKPVAGEVRHHASMEGRDLALREREEPRPVQGEAGEICAAIRRLLRLGGVAGLHGERRSQSLEDRRRQALSSTTTPACSGIGRRTCPVTSRMRTGTGRRCWRSRGAHSTLMPAFATSRHFSVCAAMNAPRSSGRAERRHAAELGDGLAHLCCRDPR